MASSSLYLKYYMITEKAIARRMKGSTITLFCSTLLVTLFILLTTSSAADTITANQTFRDNGNNTIESAGGIFELGFFSPGSSKNRYLGIWYKKISSRTVVWIANRETPITDNSGVLRVNSNGILVLVQSTNSIIWTSNSSRSVEKPFVQLLDTGNLVLRYGNDTDPENFLWQSFDHPVNNILPGMKLGWDLEKGLDRYLTSWKSSNDPSPGNFTFRVNLEGYPQMLVSQGSVVQFRFGPWDGIQFSGVAFDIPDLSFDLKLIFNQREIYATFDLVNQSIAVRFALNPAGDIQLLTWMDQTQNWTFGTYVGVIWDECDQFALCGAYGNCNITEYRLGRVPCGCLKGYEPKFPDKWNAADWSDGCVLKTEFECGNGDVFIRYPNLKLPDTRRSDFNRSMNLAECERVCSRNCSCTGYSNIDIRQGGTGCMLWFDELLDIRDYRDNGLDFFVRTATSELGEKRSANNKTRVNISIIIIPVVVGLLVLLGLFLIYMLKKRKLRRRGMLTFNPENDGRNENDKEDLDLPLFDFQIIADATNNYSQNNKLGEGGFGPVYKGILDEKQEIAVKRLSKTSRQGLHEFKNEVSCIAKLQHRNLVRLLGCCIEEGEMMLIYEYMPNKSLDYFIFDKDRKKFLDWPKRYNIINGIAKGLLYLHQDSRLRIIHRDLKASNILLDQDMSPRISDFGLARSFGGNETLVNTARVVGTYGYMSPEYAIDGLFSVKSDVYSFGVVILEVMSGEKIRGFYDSEDNLNLLGYAWKLYKEGKYLDLIDEAIVESCEQSEVFRALQIGLLCVQPYPKDRPNMPFVVSMLSSENELPQPNQPGFFTERRVPEADSSSSNQRSSVSNELSFSYFGPR